MLDVDGVAGRLQRGDWGRGPVRGFGRSHGRPFNGIVEDTPALWVTWIVAITTATGKPPPVAIVVSGERVAITSVRLTFGDRFYFVCPRCHHRREAIYIMGRRPACRSCHHLGYRSQAARAGSMVAALDAILGRPALVPGRYGFDATVLAGVIDGARDDIAARLARALDGVTVAVEP